MYLYEIVAAKQRLGPQKKLVKSLQPDPFVFKKEIQKYIELLITAKGHAWCMDVKTERQRMARLIVSALEELS